MKIETALKRRDEFVTRMRDVYANARISRNTSAALARAAENCITEMRAARVPRWAIDYVRGYDRALRDELYQRYLVFGAYVNGTFYSTYRERADYYENHGIASPEFAILTNGENKTVGHYWAEPWQDGTMRPFLPEMTKRKPKNENRK